jgi:transcription antitermination protein NusB
MGTRRKSRELALQMLFQSDMGKQDADQVRGTFWAEHGTASAEVRGFADDLFRVAIDRVAQIDGLIERHAEHWRMERMAAVDRNLLRAAVAELLGYPDTPRAVVINEALEIARRFSSPESVHFVNGVLDSIGKELEGSGQSTAPSTPQSQ